MLLLGKLVDGVSRQKRNLIYPPGGNIVQVSWGVDLE